MKLVRSTGCYLTASSRARVRGDRIGGPWSWTVNPMCLNIARTELIVYSGQGHDEGSLYQLDRFVVKFSHSTRIIRGV